MPANDMITIFALCYNEEVMLPHFIRHYRSRFPGCRIVLWDNESTDSTHDIAIDNHCEIKTYCTSNQLNDVKYLELKNNWWKDAETDWVLVCDVDEHLDINAETLRFEDQIGASFIRAQGWNMVALHDTLNPNEIKTAVRAESYDKIYLFNRKAISEINYQPGAHRAQPTGRVSPSLKIYRCFHYKYLNVDYMIKRHHIFSDRMCEANIKKGYGAHYHYPADRIRKEFKEAQENAIVIL
jgi:hypothetical protein